MTLSQDWIQSLFKAISYKSTQPESQPLSQQQRHLPCKNPLLDEQINLENLSNPIWRTGSGWGLDLTCSIFFLANFLVMIIFFHSSFLFQDEFSCLKRRWVVHYYMVSEMISVFTFVLVQDFVVGILNRYESKYEEYILFIIPLFFTVKLKKHIYSHFKVLILTKNEF